MPTGRYRLSDSLALWPALVVVLMLVAPLARLVLEALRMQGPGMEAINLWHPWQDAYLRWRLLWSLAQAGITCVLSLVMGLPLAWVLARFEFAGRTLVLRLLMLPFVVPTLVAALGVLALWGPSGVWGAALDGALDDTPWLLLYGNLFFNLCLVVRAGVDGLSRVNQSQLAAARSLGCTPWRAFWRAEWPTAAPWLMSALCLVFLYCFSGFGLALILGGQRFATVEVEIYSLVAYELQLASASVLALWTLLLTGVIALAYAYLERGLSAPVTYTPVPRHRPQGWSQWLALLATLAWLGLICALPVAVVFWRAWSLGWEAWVLVMDEEAMMALGNTLRFSLVALVLATVLGLMHAMALRGWVWWRATAFFPFVISPVTVAFGLLLLYPSLTASLGLLLMAYAVLAYPFVAKSVAAGLDALPEQQVQAARTLGASAWSAFWRVTLPQLQPALRRGMAFAAATALGEFAVTLFLSRPEWTTLTTLVYQRLSRPGQANFDAAMILSCVLMVVALLAFALIEWSAAPDESAQHAKTGRAGAAAYGSSGARHA